MIRSKKRADPWEDAALEKIKNLEHQLRRAQDTAVSLENAAAKYRDENRKLKQLVEDLRWRNYMLLKRSDREAEIFGLPRYTIADEERLATVQEILGDGELQQLRERYGVEGEHV